MADSGWALQHELTRGDREAAFRDKSLLWGHEAAERDENQFTGHLAFSVLGNAGLNSSIEKAVFISEIRIFSTSSGTKADVRNIKV